MGQTFADFLQHIDLTDEQLLQNIGSAVPLYRNKDITVKKSPIQGVGCFSQRAYSRGEEVGSVSCKGSRTTLGRLVNHSEVPNVYLQNNNFFALTDISPNQEFVVNYFTNLKTISIENQAENYNEQESKQGH